MGDDALEQLRRRARAVLERPSILPPADGHAPAPAGVLQTGPEISDNRGHKHKLSSADWRRNRAASSELKPPRNAAVRYPDRRDGLRNAPASQSSLSSTRNAAKADEAGDELELLRKQYEARVSAGPPPPDVEPGPPSTAGAARQATGWKQRLRKLSNSTKVQTPAPEPETAPGRSTQGTSHVGASHGRGSDIVLQAPAEDLWTEDAVPIREQWVEPVQHGRIWQCGKFCVACIFGFVLLALGAVLFGLSLAKWLFGLLVSLLMEAGDVSLLVNTLYTSRVGIVREWLLRSCLTCTRRCRPHDTHSVGLRVDFPLPPLPTARDGANVLQTSAGTKRFCSVHTIAMMADNYAYLLVDRTSGRKPFPAALVDPADPEAAMNTMHKIDVEQYGGSQNQESAQGRGLQLQAILITHKHWDHAAGNKAIAKHWALMPDVLQQKSSVSLRIYGGRYDNVWKCTHSLDEGQFAEVGSLRLRVLHTPCHTRGSIMYELRGVDGEDVLFTGDSLFCGGAGAQFEGTDQDLRNNMRKLWLECSPRARIFPGHEYSLAILRERFTAEIVDGGLPRSEAGLWRLCLALRRVSMLRERRQPTVATTLLNEYGYNTSFQELHSAASLVQSTWRQYVAADEAATSEKSDRTPRARIDADTATGAQYNSSFGCHRAERCLLELRDLSAQICAEIYSADDVNGSRQGTQSWWAFQSRLEQMIQECDLENLATQTPSRVQFLYDADSDHDGSEEASENSEHNSKLSTANDTRRESTIESSHSNSDWMEQQFAILEAFVTLGGDENSATISVNALKSGLTTFGDYPFSAEEIDDIVAEGLGEEGLYEEGESGGAIEVDFLALAKQMLEDQPGSPSGQTGDPHNNLGRP